MAHITITSRSSRSLLKVVSLLVMVWRVVILLEPSSFEAVIANQLKGVQRIGQSIKTTEPLVGKEEPENVLNSLSRNEELLKRNLTQMQLQNHNNPHNTDTRDSKNEYVGLLSLYNQNCMDDPESFLGIANVCKEIKERGGEGCNGELSTHDVIAADIADADGKLVITIGSRYCPETCNVMSQCIRAREHFISILPEPSSSEAAVTTMQAAAGVLLGDEKKERKCDPPKDGEPPKDDMVLVVMCNRRQAGRVAQTVRDVRTNGKYTGNVVVMHANDDLPEADAAIVFAGLDVQFKSFPKNIDRYKVPDDLPGHGPRGRGFNQNTAWIYFFKFHVFDPYFAEHWCRVLFLDGGIRANGDITHYLKAVYPTEKLYAHSDSYPLYKWKLEWQFADESQVPSHPKTKSALMEKYALEIDYPQSTMLYFNTQTVITGDPGVKDKLYELQWNYPVGNTLDQSYIALYYTNIKPIWKEPPEDEANGKRFYDYCHQRAGKRPVLLSKRQC